MTVLSTENGHTAWVCVDCYFEHHGVLEVSYGDREKLLSLIDDDAEVTSGLLLEEHECWVLADGEQVVAWMLSGVPWRELRVTEDGVEYMPGECDCEQITFSSSRCHGCGSHLAGERHALTIWDTDPTH